MKWDQFFHYLDDSCNSRILSFKLSGRSFVKGVRVSICIIIDLADTFILIMMISSILCTNFQYIMNLRVCRPRFSRATIHAQGVHSPLYSRVQYKIFYHNYRKIRTRFPSKREKMLHLHSLTPLSLSAHGLCPSRRRGHNVRGAGNQSGGRE